MSSATSSVSDDVSVVNGSNLTNTASATRSVPVAPTNTSASNASGAWRNFEACLQALSEYSPVFSNITETVDQNKVLTREVQVKDNRIATLESGAQVQIDHMHARYVMWEVEKKGLQQEKTKLKDSLTKDNQRALNQQKESYTQAIAKLRKELEVEKKTSDTLRSELGTAKQERDLKRTELDSCTKQLKEWDGYLSMLHDIDIGSFRTKLDQLFRNCRKIARNCFLRDLPDDLLKSAQWETFSDTLDVTLSFPPSNSPAAKHVRVAACIRIVARRLCTDMFTTCFIGHPQLNQVVESILIKQSETNVKTELITRALLLSTYEQAEVDAAVKDVATNASHDLQKLLSPIGGNDSFRKEIEKLFYEAADVWKEVRHSKTVFEASMDDEPHWQWLHLEEFTIPDIKAQPGARQFEKLTLFPRVFIPETNEVVYPGYVLLPNQNTVFAAEEELAAWKVRKASDCARNGSIRGGLLRRARRPSAHSDGRNGASLSPTISKSEGNAASGEYQRGPTQVSQGPNGYHGG